MLKLYEVYMKPIGFRDDDRAFVVAINSSQAKFLAWKEQKCKFYHETYTDLRARTYHDQSLLEELGEDLEQSRWLFDNETYEDVLEAERRWFDGQCLP